MVKWEDLTGIEREWAEEWVEGVCELQARGPVGEPEEERAKEFERCKKTFMEDKKKLATRARRWMNRLRKAIGQKTLPE